MTLAEMREDTTMLESLESNSWYLNDCVSQIATTKALRLCDLERQRFPPQRDAKNFAICLPSPTRASS